MSVEPVTPTRPFRETPGYQQQYDDRGHPEFPASRQHDRASRRAMNDVLATVGVCIGVKADGNRKSVKDRSRATVDQVKVDDVSTENSIGLMVDSIDLVFISLARMALLGLSYRLQVSELIRFA